MAACEQLTPDQMLAEDLGKFWDNPLGYVRYCFPWGEPGALQQFTGPDRWQEEVLREIGRQVAARRFDGVHPVDPIRLAISSGHGIGKSVMAAWLVLWLMSTRPGAQGTITANTVQQLDSKTWASVQRWHKLSINAHWFRVTSEKLVRVGDESNWFCSRQTCREENSEAFAGQHAANSTSFYLFDEASAVPDGIWEVAEGGLTDGEPMIFAFGNPTRNSGKFHRVCFGVERGRWTTRCVDSRDCRFTNKDLIQQWVDDYGEDSDFVRVRVRGLCPSASDLQFIDSTRVYEAQKREAVHFKDDPLILGVDVARGGSASTVFRFRRGLDARTIPPIVLSGEESRDSMRVASVLMDLMDREQYHDRVKPKIAFVDSGFGGPIVDRAHQLGFDNVIEVSFGGQCPDPRHYANMRSWMWSRMKNWLERGAIEQDQLLETDLTGPGYRHDKQDRIVLESKDDMEKRGLSSPDNADALALTFAQPVAPLTEGEYERRPLSQDYGPNAWMV